MLRIRNWSMVERDLDEWKVKKGRKEVPLHDSCLQIVAEFRKSRGEIQNRSCCFDPLQKQTCTAVYRILLPQLMKATVLTESSCFLSVLWTFYVPRHESGRSHSFLPYQLFFVGIFSVQNFIRNIENSVYSKQSILITCRICVHL